MVNYSFRGIRRLRRLPACLALGVLTISIPADASTPTPTTLSLASTPIPAVYSAGEAVTYTATLGAATGTPTGTVTFTVDGSVTTPYPVDPSHSASILLHPSAGTHTFSASYSGD